MIQSAAAMLAVALICAQQPPTGSFTLGGVQVSGASRYTMPEVVRLSRLESGKAVSVADLDAAAQRLVNTGLFQRVSYKYVTRAGQLTVTFEIEEPKWTIPVILDNFVWFTGKELNDGLRQMVPSFDGTAPDSDAAPEFMKGALQKLLEVRGLPGRVDFTLQQNNKTKALSFLFSVKDPSPIVCGVRFEGASAVPEEQLIVALRRSMPVEYSRFFLQNVSAGTLTDIYRQRGHWRAAFAEPKAALDAVPGCAGVAVTLSVDEGPSYVWAGAEWKGNAAVAAAQLDTVFGMNSGETAALARIDDGIRRVHQVYEKQGYILQTAAYAPRLDDAARRATFEIRIDERQQFRMGNLEFAGFPDNVVERLKAKWAIKAGDVFDGSYPLKFVSVEIRPLLKTASPNIELRADEDKPLAHVKFVLQ
jgi:outer membrane protein insertion porin family